MRPSVGGVLTMQGYLSARMKVTNNLTARVWLLRKGLGDTASKALREGNLWKIVDQLSDFRNFTVWQQAGSRNCVLHIHVEVT